MPKRLFEIPKWGPKRLRDIFEEIQNQINERTPLASESGIAISEKPDGMEICIVGSPSSSGTAGESPGGSGASVALYGARNGAPAIFHLLQSSAPTAAP